MRQRASRGWGDNELWNLDAHLCQHLGSMLARYVEDARNHPPELEVDEWIRQVRTASEALLADDPDDAQRVAAARMSLHWAADNLLDLWDCGARADAGPLSVGISRVLGVGIAGAIHRGVEA